MSPLVPQTDLHQLDPVLHDIIGAERERQRRKIILIASESICPPAVREALACEFGNIYAEGYPSPRTFFEPPQQLSNFQFQLTQFRRYSNRRYYKGCEYVDILEQTARRRTAEVFANSRVPASEIFVNVQPLSGAAANNAVYNAFCKPGDVVMGAALSHGGHLTHGASVNRSGANFRSVAYQLSRSGRLDYDAIEALALEHKPRLLIGGFSAYPWDIDWQRLRAIADRCGAVLLADIAHLAGMVAAGLLNNPVGHAHVVSFTTHKTLCGPRGAMLLASEPTIAAKLDFGVFPGEQGGPHIHTLAAKAVAMKLAASPEFKQLQQRVLDNARALADAFVEQGLELAYGGTNTHMCLLDLRRVPTPNGEPLTGEIASRILDLCGITCNKNTIAGDKNAIHPSGLRFGTTWATQRGFTPEHMKRLAAVVSELLRSIHPFTYIGGRLEWGRGKVGPEALERAAATVDQLLSDADSSLQPQERSLQYPHFPSAATAGARRTALTALHESQAVRLLERDGWLVPAGFGDPAREKRALTEGVALLDAGGTLLVEVGMGRAAQLLDGATTADVTALEPGQATAGMLLDPQGKPMACLVILRLPADELGGERFWLRIGTREPDRMLRWLRGLSDGYLLHDADLWRKCEGPAVIEDLGRPSDGREALTVIGLRGPKAAEAFQQAFGRPAPTSEAGLELVAEGGFALRQPAGCTAGIDLLIGAGQATRVWSRLLEAGAQPVGCEVMAEVFPQPPLTPETDPLAEPFRARVRLDKAFFIGQQPLRQRAEPGRGLPEFDWHPPADAALQQTCLFAEHQRHTSAKHLVPFAGWRMPVMYDSILGEHEAVRRNVGLFDVSHMGVLEFSGPFAERFLDLLTTNYVPMLVPGQAQYSYLLAHDGRCIDDIIVCRLEAQRFMVVVNAANADEDEAWFRAVAAGEVQLDPERPDVRVSGRVTIRNLKDVSQAGEQARVDLALQGPRTLDVLSTLVKPDLLETLRKLRKFSLARGPIAGVDTIVARTGYTGAELGFELYLHPERAPAVWNALMEAGAPYKLTLCGLGARDSLRTEAGYPLHGHELAGPHRVTPLEAGYGSFVKLHKPFFPGRAACLEGHRHRNRRIVRFEVDEKGGRVLRPGNPVLDGKKGEYAGVVTSAASTGERQVGLALIAARFAKLKANLQILPLTENDKSPPACAPLQLQNGDWMTVPRSATILSRFMRPGEKPRSGSSK